MDLDQASSQVMVSPFEPFVAYQLEVMAGNSAVGHILPELVGACTNVFGVAFHHHRY